MRNRWLLASLWNLMIFRNCWAYSWAIKIRKKVIFSSFPSQQEQEREREWSSITNVSNKVSWNGLNDDHVGAVWEAQEQQKRARKNYEWTSFFFSLSHSLAYFIIADNIKRVMKARCRESSLINWCYWMRRL